MTARLPTVGGDDNDWGSILNSFLEVAHNSDGSLQTTAVQQAGAVTSVNTISPNNGNVTLTAAEVGALPATDDLSAIATANPTADSVSMNSYKITNLENGSNPQDAVAYGQLGSAAFEPTSAFDAAGAAATAQSNAEAASLPVTGGSLTDGANIAVGTTTGTKIGTATSQKLGFFGATPVAQQTASNDLGTSLANLGLRASGGYSLTVQDGLSVTGPNQVYAQADTSNVSLNLGPATPSTRLADAASNTITYTLPSTSNPGYIFTLVKTDSSTNTVTVDAGSGNTINGTRYYTLGDQYQYVAVISTSTSGAWQVIDSGGPAIAPAGLTGATAATRFVGGTTSGQPESGTFDTGDFVISQSGQVWVCTAGGSPGAWTFMATVNYYTPNIQPSPGTAAAGTTAIAAQADHVHGQPPFFAPTGLTGATNPARFVGGTNSSNAPVTGTFAVGDFVVSQNGEIFVCTTAGSPGTWTGVLAGYAISSGSAPVLTSSNSLTGNSSSSGEWQNVTTITITAQGGESSGDLLFVGQQAQSSPGSYARVRYRVRQQAAMASAPLIELYVNDYLGFAPSNFTAILTTNTSSQTIVELWLQAPLNNETYSLYALDYLTVGSEATVRSGGSTWTATGSLPSGTQTVGVPTPSAAAIAPAGVTPQSLSLAMLTVPLGPSVGSGLTSTAGLLRAALVTAAVTTTLTYLGCLVATAGVTAGTGVNEMAIFSASGVQLGITGDMTTAFESTGKVEGALTSSVNVTAGTNYYLAVLCDFTGTSPVLFGNSSALGTFGTLTLTGTASSQTSMPSTLPGLSESSNLPIMWAR